MGFVKERLNNSGSHKDMDVELFLRSAKTLRPFFEKFISIGMNSLTYDFSILFNKLRISGIEAEQEMFSETGQVNTHKGAIFSFALILGVIGRLSKKENYNFSIFELLDNVKMCASNISNEFSTDSVSTKRKEMYEKYNLKGARGEAESGYQTTSKYLTPIFQEYREYDEQHRLFAGESRKSKCLFAATAVERRANWRAGEEAFSLRNVR